MALNKDGLEPGQPVDFATVQRINRQRGKRDASTDEAPKRRRKAKAGESSDRAAAVPEATEGEH